MIRLQQIPVRRGIVLAGALLGTLLLVASLLLPAAAPPPAWQTAALAEGSLETTISSTGTLAAVETVEVGTQISGTIREIRVDYNDVVRRGEILARIDPALSEAALSEAAAELARTRANLAAAEEDLERNRPLYDKGYLSPEEFSPLRTAAATARAGLDAAEAALLRARTNLDYTVIRSPIDGKVIKRSVESGQTVAASLNTPTLFVIARDLTRMRIEVSVDESDIGRIREGQPVRFTVQAWPEERFTGTVRQIRLQPTTVSNVVNYTVVVAADNPRGLLLPGMTATVDFVVSRSDNVLLAPNAALRFVPPGGALPANGGPTLYLPDPDGTLRPIAVVKGESDGVRTVVSGPGLYAGLSVATGIDAANPAPTSRKGIFSFMKPPQPSRSGGPGSPP